MLRVTAIQKLDPFRYLVSIDRNEIVRTYVFTTPDKGPDGEDAPTDGEVSVSPPPAFFVDMADYTPAGWTPSSGPEPAALAVPRDLVRKLILGQEVALPVVLDPR